MQAFFVSLRLLDAFTLAAPILLNLVLCLFLFQSDFILLLGERLWRATWGRPDSFKRLAPGERPTGLIVIPSLLRDADDFNAITTTIESCATNGYPSELYLIASVDGRKEFPKLYAELNEWIARQSFPANVHVYTAGTETRLGKMMAVEAGVEFMRELVAHGTAPEFPKVYFSIDGDGTLGEDALERLVHKLCSRHWLTGNMRRVVAGKICIRPDLFWQGWRKFFSLKGQLYIQVAREFVVSNVARYNWKMTPQIGIPGALYCTWSEIIVQAPRFMGFMQTLTFKDWVRWMLGAEPPKFSQSNAKSLPEALTGASDDTCIAFIASIAGWVDDKLTFDAPRTPLHALGRLFVSYFVDRSHQYEPESRVYTYTPPTLKGLWKQRVRWNSSRVECGGRFWRAFWYHWEIGFPVSSHLLLLLETVFNVGFYYILLPFYCLTNSHALLAFALGYAAQTIAYSLYTAMALLLERDWRNYWRVLFCLPLASLHCILINCFGCVVGVTKDIFLFGNTTNFAPEWTLAKGRCERIALLFRTRRFFALCVRAAVYGDVPLGTFWFGWHATPWTPGGFEGWTTGKKQRPIVPREGLALLRRAKAAPAAVTAPAAIASEPEARPAVLPPVVTESAMPIAPIAPIATVAPRVRTSMRPSLRPTGRPSTSAPRPSRRPTAHPSIPALAPLALGADLLAAVASTVSHSAESAIEVTFRSTIPSHIPSA